MYSLFIDTHDKDISICLYKDGIVLDKLIKESERNHSAYTMPMIDSIIKNNNISINDINEILVVIGPGSFTGVRIGVTIAKMLAYNLKVSIKTITSLELFAVSSNINKDKLPIIRDIKGVYGAGYNENNELIKDYFYLDNSSFDNFVLNNNYEIIENISIDFQKIYDYMKQKESLNPHLVNPLYIKMIEALKK